MPDYFRKLLKSSSKLLKVRLHTANLQLIGPISYLGACLMRTKVTKCIREKMTMCFRELN